MAMPQGNPGTPQAVPRRPTVSTLCRFEWVADMTIALTAGVPTNTQIQPPNNVFPNDRFVSGMLLQWEGRIQNAGANGPTGTLIDAPFALIDTLIVKGTHRIRGNPEVFLNARGPDLRELARNYQASNPNVQGFPPSLALNANNDIRFDIPVFFYPMNVTLPERVDHLLDAPNYDALTLLIQVADDNNVFTYGTRGAPTFTAFGSATGNPRIRLGLWIAQAGRHAFEGFVPARVWRYFNEDTSSDMTTTANNVRLSNMNIPRGNRIRNILFKTGAVATGRTAGNNAYQTSTNTAIANLKLIRGINKITRFYADWFQGQEDSRNAYAIAPSTGYLLADYAQNATVRESLDLTGAAAGPSGDVDCYIQGDVTGASNQGLVALWEEIRGTPQYPVR